MKLSGSVVLTGLDASIEANEQSFKALSVLMVLSVSLYAM